MGYINSWLQECGDKADNATGEAVAGWVAVGGDANTFVIAYGHRVTLQVRKDNIIELENTHSIINFVYRDDIYGRHGIIDAAGDGVKQEYDAEKGRRDENRDRRPLKSGAGNLPYKAIFHVLVTDELPIFSNNLHAALKFADREGMRSIAIPGMTPSSDNQKKIIDKYLEVLYEFEGRVQPSCLHLIDIVCSSGEDEDYHDKQMKKNTTMTR